MKYLPICCFLALLCPSIRAGNLSGVVYYAGTSSAPLRAVNVILFDNQGNKLDSVYTDAAGHFAFGGLLPGIYQVTAYPAHPWGGGNAADALLALKHFVGLETLDSLSLIAADVNGNGIINSLDALIITKRFAGIISTFATGDWITGTSTVSLADTAILQCPLLCYGDVNKSYVPDNGQFLICGDVFTDSRDNRQYGTVLLGSQCWMTANLNIGVMIPGTGNQAPNGIIEKYCYNDDTANCSLFGGLYQWTEMMQYTSTGGTRGICPEGFHLPRGSEWDTLIGFLGPDSLAGGMMKETGFDYWDPPNEGATNESGFSARGSGNRIGNGTFANLRTEAKIWTSTQQNLNSAWFFNLYNHLESVEQNNHGKNNGLSARCVKDL